MNLKITIIVIILFCQSNSFAQSYLNHFKWFDIYTGITTSKGNLTTLRGGNIISKSSGSGNGFHAGFGLNLPFLAVKESSVGIHVAGLIYLGDGGGGLSFPFMLQYKFGTDAVLESKRKLGFGLSAGYNIILNSSETMATGTFYFPTAGPEINYSTGWGLFKLRCYAQFGTKKSTRNDDGDIEMGNFQMPLILALGYCSNY